MFGSSIESERRSFEEKVRMAGEVSRKFFKLDKDVRIEDEDIDTAKIIYERMKQIGFVGFEPVILPERELVDLEILIGTNKKRWPGMIKPRHEFFRLLNDRVYPAELGSLKQGIYLIDGRKKPAYADNAGQMYEKDEFMERILTDLRNSGKIDYSGEVPAGSRFSVSYKAINLFVISKVKELIGARFLGWGELRLPRFCEYNLIGNMGLAQIGHGDTSEWFADSVGGVKYLYGGDKSLNMTKGLEQNENRGLGYVASSEYYNRGPKTGFRLMVAVYNED